MTRKEELLRRITKCSILLAEARSQVANYPELAEDAALITAVIEKIQRHVDKCDRDVEQQYTLASRLCPDE